MEGDDRSQRRIQRELSDYPSDMHQAIRDVLKLCTSEARGKLMSVLDLYNAKIVEIRNEHEQDMKKKDENLQSILSIAGSVMDPDKMQAKDLEVQIKKKEVLKSEKAISAIKKAIAKSSQRR